MKSKFTVLGNYPEINYILVDRGSKAGQRFVAGWSPVILYNDDGSQELVGWSQGHYFDSILEAVAYINNKINENREIRRR